ncbi:MAG: AhpC/TSA family protein [Flavobacteriales bacterium]|nr:AhpC/TSA family protein [Flavobacteriales bacterium]
MKLLLTILLAFSIFTIQGQDVMYDICPIKNSESVPNALVFDRDGKEVDLKSYIGKRPVVVVFYRGGWCPYCMRHLSALQEIKPQMDSLGFELIGITPDTYTKLDTSIKKGGDIDFQLFSDKNINAINAFGIGWKINDELYAKYKDSYGMDTEWWTGATHHVLPVPAVFIISNGEIQYQHVDPDYSKRLSPEILLSYIASINAAILEKGSN